METPLSRSISPLKFRHGMLCDPSLIPDPKLRALMQWHMKGPVCVLPVSSEFYSLLGEQDKAGVHLRLAVCGSDGPRALVFMLQVSGHQLRCVVSLHRPTVLRLLHEASVSGRMPLVLLDTAKQRYTGFACPVFQGDIDAVLRMKGSPLDAEHAAVELVYATLLCHVSEELGSVIPDEALREVEIVQVSDASDCLPFESMNLTLQ